MHPWAPKVLLVEGVVVVADVVVALLGVALAAGPGGGGGRDLGDDLHLAADGLRAEALDKVGGEEAVVALLDAVEPALKNNNNK